MVRLLVLLLAALLYALPASANYKVTSYNGVDAAGQICAVGTVMSSKDALGSCFGSYTTPSGYVTCGNITKDPVGIYLISSSAVYESYKIVSFINTNCDTTTSTSTTSIFLTYQEVTDPINQCPDGSTPVNGVCPVNNTLPPADDAFCSTYKPSIYSSGTGSLPTGTSCLALDSDSGHSGGCNYDTDWAISGMGTDGHWESKQTAVGTACTPSGQTQVDYTSNMPPQGCIQGSDGHMVCMSTTTTTNAQGQNCGTVNGESVCIESVPNDSCASTSTGSIVCVGSATPPPNIDGSPQTASAQISTQTSTGGNVTYNYYSSPTASTTGDQSAIQQSTSATASNTAQTADNTAAIKQALEDLKAGQCGAPGQPPCETKEHEGDAPGYSSESLPEQRSDTMYTRRYPDGLVGVWNDKKDQLFNSAFVESVVQNFSLGSINGNYPIWTIDLNLGPLGNYGSADLSVPPWIWDVLSAIVLFSAALACRRIIFGG